MKKKMVILGGGVSGKSLLELAALCEYDAVIVNDNDTEFLPYSDIVVASPGVHPLKSHLYRQAVAERRFMTGELDFGAGELPENVVKLAITGTNGKTTTTELTTHLLNALGFNAVACGNIGTPVSAVASEMKKNKEHSIRAVVIEVSSFQLELASSFSPDAAVLLNLKSDHEERYSGGFKEYCSVKKSIFKNTPDDKCFYGVNSFFKTKGRGAHYSGNTLFYGDTVLLDDVSQTGFQAEHNRENLAAAAELILSVIPLEKLDVSLFADAVKSFKFGRHRIEFVAEKNGVYFYNDSKATNPSAVTAAVNALRGRGGKIVLMLGGSDKGMDFSELAEFENDLRAVILFGAAGETIGRYFSGNISRMYTGMDFVHSVKSAASAAEQGDIVLLSPACASFDMFKGYDDRGNRFCDIVKSL